MGLSEVRFDFRIIISHTYTKELSINIYFILVGKLNDGHWTLDILNVQEKTFMHMERKRKEPNKFDKFKDFLNVTKDFNNFSTDGWRIQDGSHYKYIKQKDLHNCGIFVLKCIKDFIDNKNF